MKFCQRCGEEIMDGEVFCPGCGCTVAKEIEKTEISYAKCVKVAVTTAILSAVAIVLGIIVGFCKYVGWRNIMPGSRVYCAFTRFKFAKGI